MSTKKSAALLPELLTARSKRKAACGLGGSAADAVRSKIAAMRRKRRSTPSIGSGAQRGPAPALAPAAPPPTAESIFHRKGTASAADFRPAYWRYY